MEAAANVVVGYGVAVLTQLAVFPWFGLPARVTDALGIGAVMTGVSVVRTFALRRLFEALRAWGGDPAVASTVHLGKMWVVAGEWWKLLGGVISGCERHLNRRREPPWRSRHERRYQELDIRATGGR